MLKGTAQGHSTQESPPFPHWKLAEGTVKSWGIPRCEIWGAPDHQLSRPLPNVLALRSGVIETSNGSLHYQAIPRRWFLGISGHQEEEPHVNSTVVWFCPSESCIEYIKSIVAAQLHQYPSDILVSSDIETKTLLSHNPRKLKFKVKSLLAYSSSMVTGTSKSCLALG